MLRKEKEELSKAIDFVDKQKKEILQLTKNNKKKESELFRQERNLSTRIDFFKSKQELVNTFENIADEVTEKKLSIEKIESEFWKKENLISLKERITNFVSDCKKIVTNLATQLSKYKITFEKFWKWKPIQFRELADKIEEEKCETFEKYIERKSFGHLNAQKIEKTLSQKKR